MRNYVSIVALCCQKKTWMVLHWHCLCGDQNFLLVGDKVQSKLKLWENTTQIHLKHFPVTIKSQFSSKISTVVNDHQSIEWITGFGIRFKESFSQPSTRTRWMRTSLPWKCTFSISMQFIQNTSVFISTIISSLRQYTYCFIFPRYYSIAVFYQIYHISYRRGGWNFKYFSPPWETFSQSYLTALLYQGDAWRHTHSFYIDGWY